MKLRNFTIPTLAFFALNTWASSLLSAPSVMAFSPTDLSALSSHDVKNLVQTVGIGSDHRSYMPASSQTMAIGLDVGVDLAVLQLPNNYRSSMAQSGALGVDQAPSLMAFPRLNLHKALLMGLDVGFSYGSFGNYRLIGADVKWNLVPGSWRSPSIAIQGSGSFSELVFFKTRTYSADVVVSQKISGFFEPYFGAGYQFVSGVIDLQSLSLSQGLATGVSESSDTARPRFYLGLPTRIMFLTLTGQVDYSMAKVMTYGMKFSLSL